MLVCCHVVTLKTLRDSVMSLLLPTHPFISSVSSFWLLRAPGVFLGRVFKLMKRITLDLHSVSDFSLNITGFS